MRKTPIVITDYDPRWPEMFEQERARIMAAVSERILAIEHVGSTAAPGLAAKPLIDIMVGIRQLDDARACIAPLEAIGYEYVPEYEAQIPDRRYFRRGGIRGSEWESTHHLHMVEMGGPFWERHLLFRDYLRAHPQDAARYAALKRDLAARAGRDREAYTDGKTDFVREILAKARAEGRT